MKIKQICIFGIITFFILWKQNVSGQSLDSIIISKKLPILNGRAFLTFPQNSTMSKPCNDNFTFASPDEQTRIKFNIGEMHMIFFSEELYAIADKNFIETVISKSGFKQFSHSILINKNGLEQIMLTPTIFDSIKGNILINSLIVKSKDNTLFKISVYVNSSAFKIKEQFQKLSEKVFATLIKGDRDNLLISRQEVLPISGTNKSLTFSLPINYCVAFKQDSEYQIYELHKFQNYNDSNLIQLTISFSKVDFSLLYEIRGQKESEGQKTKGIFLDKNIEWFTFKSGGYDKQFVISLDSIRQGMKADVLMFSNQIWLINEMTNIVENIRLKSN